MAFRGGTALHKLYLSAARYSGDIDLVQIKTGMQRAKAQGKNISRPKLAKNKLNRIMELKEQELSMNQIVFSRAWLMEQSITT